MNEIKPKIYKEGNPIPLQLECTVNDTVVYYDKLHKYAGEYPGYIFYIIDNIPENEAARKVEILIKRILADHDEPEHGVRWETKSFKQLEHPLYHMFEWHYRIRDSY